MTELMPDLLKTKLQCDTEIQYAYTTVEQPVIELNGRWLRIPREYLSKAPPSDGTYHTVENISDKNTV